MSNKSCQTLGLENCKRDRLTKIAVESIHQTLIKRNRGFRTKERDKKWMGNKKESFTQKSRKLGLKKCQGKRPKNLSKTVKKQTQDSINRIVF